MVQRSSTYWDIVARSYPQRLSLLYGKKKIFDRSLVVKLPRGRILDAGCGQGRDLSHFAQLHFSEVVGIDSSPKMCELARQNIVQFNLPEHARRVTVKQENIKDLSFEDGLFDVVCSFSAIDHLSTEKGRERAISELVRVTKPGGFIVLTFPNSRALASMLKNYDELIISPANYFARDMVQVCNRSGTSEFMEYAHETTYSHEDVQRMVAEHNLQDFSVTTGVMQQCFVALSKNEANEFADLPSEAEILLKLTHGQDVSSAVNNIIGEWLKIPETDRGLRLGLVARRPQ